MGKRSSENARNREPLELNDISGAGKAEYFRQWMLVSRRAKFQPEANRKPHRLWLSIGGSEGHSSQLALDIVENFDDNGHMEIEVSTQQRSDLIQQTQESSKDKREAAKEQAFKDKLDKVLGFFKSSPNELRVRSDIKAFMPCNDDSAKAIVYHLSSHVVFLGQVEKLRFDRLPIGSLVGVLDLAEGLCAKVAFVPTLGPSEPVEQSVEFRFSKAGARPIPAALGYFLLGVVPIRASFGVEGQFDQTKDHHQVSEVEG